MEGPGIESDMLGPTVVWSVFDISASTTYLEGRTMANLWGDRALSYYRECRPDEYQAIPDKETFFLE